jgi:hypothetical protein
MQRSGDLLSDKKATSVLVRIPVTITYNAIDRPQRTQGAGIDVMMKGKAEFGFFSWIQAQNEWGRPSSSISPFTCVYILTTGAAIAGHGFGIELRNGESYTTDPETVCWNGAGTATV